MLNKLSWCRLNKEQEMEDELINKERISAKEMIDEGLLDVCFYTDKSPEEEFKETGMFSDINEFEKYLEKHKIPLGIQRETFLDKVKKILSL